MGCDGYTMLGVFFVGLIAGYLLPFFTGER